MAMIKHGAGKVLKDPQPEQDPRDWSDQDEQDLDAETDKDDQ